MILFDGKDKIKQSFSKPFLKPLSVKEQVESFLHIRDGFPFKHPGHFIFLDQCMLPCPLHISCAFMGNLKDVSHLLYKCTL